MKPEETVSWTSGLSGISSKDILYCVWSHTPHQLKHCDFRIIFLTSSLSARTLEVTFDLHLSITSHIEKISGSTEIGMELSQ